MDISVPWLVILALSHGILGTTEIGNHISIDIKAYVKEKGYKLEERRIQTEDGYLLTYHRIKSEKPPDPKLSKYPVLLQHSLITSSADFLVPDNNALAYMLVDGGFDVWLGNSRGNQYSRGHVKLSPEDSEFWNFGLDEMALDVAAGIDDILNTTQGSQVLYVGHSHGVMYPLILAASKPQYIPAVAALVALAPACVLSLNTTKESRLIMEYVRKLTDLNNTNSFIMTGSALKEDFCSFVLSQNGTSSCGDVSQWLLGDLSQNSSIEMQSVLFGTSMAALQYVKNQVEDGGIVKPYNLTAVGYPVHIFFSDHDIFVTPQDVSKFKASLRFAVLNLVKEEQFNHMDFVWGAKAKTLVYDPLVKVLTTVVKERTDVSESISTRKSSRRRRICSKNENCNLYSLFKGGNVWSSFNVKECRNCRGNRNGKLNKLAGIHSNYKKGPGTSTGKFINIEYGYTYLLQTINSYKLYILSTFNIWFDESDSLEVLLQKVRVLLHLLRSYNSRCDTYANDLYMLLTRNEWLRNRLTLELLHSNWQQFNNVKPIINNQKSTPTVKSIIITNYPSPTTNKFEINPLITKYIEVHRRNIQNQYNIIFNHFEDINSYFNKVYWLLQKVNNLKNCVGSCREIKEVFQKTTVMNGIKQEKNSKSNDNYLNNILNLGYNVILETITFNKRYIEKTFGIKFDENVVDERKFFEKLRELISVVYGKKNECFEYCRTIVDIITNNVWYEHQEQLHSETKDEFSQFYSRIEKYISFIKTTYNIELSKTDERNLLEKLKMLENKLRSDPRCFGDCKELLTLITTSDWYTNRARMEKNVVKVEGSKQFIEVLRFIKKHEYFMERSFRIRFERDDNETIVLTKLKTLITEIEKNIQSCTGECKEIYDFLRTKTSSWFGDRSKPNEKSNFDPINKYNLSSDYRTLLKELEQYVTFIEEKFDIKILSFEKESLFFENVVYLVQKMKSLGESCVDECKIVYELITNNAWYQKEVGSRNNLQNDLRVAYDRLLELVMMNRDLFKSVYAIEFHEKEDDMVFFEKLQQLVAETEQSKHDCKECKTITLYIQSNKWYLYQYEKIKSSLKINDVTDAELLKNLRRFRTHIDEEYSISNNSNIMKTNTTKV